MKRIWITAAALFVVLGGVVFLFVWGYLGSLIGGGTDHPPCETLPSHAEVSRAIKEHPALAEQIEAAGDGVQVVVGTPCDDPDAAVLEVQVSNDDEQTRVDKVLTESEGFGVPVVIHRR